jgi:hypothetical protein
MARLDWDKAGRARLWREGVRNSWSGVVPAAPAQKASGKQVAYVQLLLVRAGRRALAPAEADGLTAAEAHKMIDSLKGL